MRYDASKSTMDLRFGLVGMLHGPFSNSSHIKKKNTSTTGIVDIKTYTKRNIRQGRAIMHRLTRHLFFGIQQIVKVDEISLACNQQTSVLIILVSTM